MLLRGPISPDGRAPHLCDADGPGENNYRVHVTRASDSRFDRALTLSFIDRQDAEEAVPEGENEMRFLHQSLTRRVDKFVVAPARMPNVDEDLWIHLPKEHIYIVSK